MKIFTGPLALAAIAAGSILLAGCQSAPPNSGDYKFELVGKPTFTEAGTTVIVRFVHSDESPVGGAQLYAEHWINTGAKTRPSVRQRTALQADGPGSFTYHSDTLREGDTLELAATVGADNATIRGKVEIP